MKGETGTLLAGAQNWEFQLNSRTHLVSRVTCWWQYSVQKSSTMGITLPPESLISLVLSPASQHPGWHHWQVKRLNLG